tara:strand:- start:1672 stop:2229 length:558 start_codon:yes stop_codon:yes gene_type:complete
VNIEEYIKNEGYSPFASEETIARLSKEEEKDRGLVKHDSIAPKNRPMAFNQLITCNWIDPDLFWGWRVRVEDGQAQGFMTLLTVKEFHSAESDVRTKMGGPARGAVGDVTAGLNCIFAMRRFCPVIEITHTFDKSILIGQTLETENISFVKSDGIITQTGVQRIAETGEQIGTYKAICKDLKHER